jgi:hypothetical protein
MTPTLFLIIAAVAIFSWCLGHRKGYDDATNRPNTGFKPRRSICNGGWICLMNYAQMIPTLCRYLSRWKKLNLLKRWQRVPGNFDLAFLPPGAGREENREL